METSEKLMTAEKLENLISQLKSSEEDQILTLNIIDNYDVLENLVFFILLKKKGLVGWDMWEQHAPNATKTLMSKDVLGDNPNLTYQFIIEVAATHNVNVQQMQYFMDEFGNHLLEVLRSYGYDFLEKVEIKLTEKYKPGKDIKL